MKKLFLTITIVIAAGFLYSQQTFQDVTSAMGISGQTGLGHAVAGAILTTTATPISAFPIRRVTGFGFTATI